MNVLSLSIGYHTNLVAGTSHSLDLMLFKIITLPVTMQKLEYFMERYQLILLK